MARREQSIDRLADDEPQPEAPVARAFTLVAPPPPGAKARQLFLDARAVSLEHLSDVAAAMVTLRELLEAVVDSGDLYVAGVREFAERLSEDLFWKAESLELLTETQRNANRPTPRRR